MKYSWVSIKVERKSVNIKSFMIINIEWDFPETKCNIYECFTKLLIIFCVNIFNNNNNKKYSPMFVC